MDLGDLTQIVLVCTTALIMGRVGLALARLIERRATPKPTPETDDRLRALEDECAALRQEVVEIQERQDFTERALLQDPARGVAPLPPPRERVVTPH